MPCWPLSVLLVIWRPNDCPPPHILPLQSTRRSRNSSSDLFLRRNRAQSYQRMASPVPSTIRISQNGSNDRGCGILMVEAGLEIVRDSELGAVYRVYSSGGILSNRLYVSSVSCHHLTKILTTLPVNGGNKHE